MKGALQAAIDPESDSFSTTVKKTKSDIDIASAESPRQCIIRNQ
jgi:hypothetical protein